MQVGAELQDCRDVVHAIIRPPRLSQRQFDLVTSTSATETIFDDPSHDPSVRFFGLDWQQLFGRCFSLSLNINIFRTQVIDPDLAIDLLLLNSILKDLARIEVDVTSHGEAVLNGRLSKSQQLIIQQEQTRLNSLTPAMTNCKVSKSRSFRDTNGNRRSQRQLSRYRKTRTTDLNKLSMGMAKSEEEVSKEWKEVLDESAALENKLAAAEGSTGEPRRKTSFIQNVSNIFKNIR